MHVHYLPPPTQATPSVGFFHDPEKQTPSSQWASPRYLGLGQPPTSRAGEGGTQRPPSAAKGAGPCAATKTMRSLLGCFINRGRQRTQTRATGALTRRGHRVVGRGGPAPTRGAATQGPGGRPCRGASFEQQRRARPGLCASRTCNVRTEALGLPSGLRVTRNL